MYIALVATLAFLSACQSETRREDVAKIDSLNERAYRLRYVNIDSVRNLSMQAILLSSHYPDGRSEALCNLAYVKYQQMDFGGVDSILASIRENCDNPFVRLCADVMQMKTCQRTGDGQRFYASKTNAENRMKRIDSRFAGLSTHERCLLVYAKSEFHIIASTYAFYQEQDSMAREEISRVLPCFELQVDTAQWIYYNYMMGSGGLAEGDTEDGVTLSEFDYLFHAYMLSTRERMAYFQANALQSLAMMFLHNDSLLYDSRPQECRILAAMQSEGDTLVRDLPRVFARKALALFRGYDDLFQTACTYRTLGEIDFECNDYEHALDDYMKALHCVNVHHLRYYEAISPDTLSAFNPDALHRSVENEWMADSCVLTVPDWIAGIRQQFSLVFSALDMKQASDYNRNFYLDLIQSTNQNQELENRMEVLKQQTRGLYLRMLLAFFLALVTIFLFRARMVKVREEKEDTEERLAVSLQRMKSNKQSNAENRAKVSLVHAIVPFLDRIGGEVIRMRQEGRVTPERREYIMELIDEIDRLNNVLTEWIKMEQGELNLHISTFSLEKLYGIVQEGHYAFDQKQVTLSVEPIEALLKADESLTLFMINTLADNARKFTPPGGRVTLSAVEGEDYVEVRVEDTGHGLSEAEVDMINNSKVYDASQIGKEEAEENKGFGFGLMNCRGIIEKYKKTSSIFSCCTFGVRSRVGEGSTFFFRLPRVLYMLPAMLLFPLGLQADGVEELYESVYVANVEGRYADALHNAESAIEALNAVYPDQPIMLFFDGAYPMREAAEMLWAQQELEADYILIVNLRNEMALAALALHRWELYNYNNRVCIRLHKFIHQDKTLPNYYRRLQQTHRNGNWLLASIAVLAVVVVVLAYRRLYPVRKLKDDTDRMADEQTRTDYEQSRLYVQNQVLDNCLSTIKHESMYYPSRIRLLAEKMEDADIGQLGELVDYYHHIYTLLCQQADEQVSQPAFRRQRVRLGNCDVWADPTLLDYLIASLRRGMQHDAVQLRQQVTDEGRFVSVSIYDDGRSLTPDEMSMLFSPALGHIPFLVAKQILREHDTYCNHPGLQLAAGPTQEGYRVYFTLLKS